MNDKHRTHLFSLSALLLLMGAILHFIQLGIAPYLFAIGSAGFALCYLTLPVKELDFRRRRLHRYNVMASLLLIFASGLMFAARNEWIICLTVASLFILYTAFVTPKEKTEE